MVIVDKITTTILSCESYVKRTKNINIESLTGCVLFLLLSIVFGFGFGKSYRYFMDEEEASLLLYVLY